MSRRTEASLHDRGEPIDAGYIVVSDGRHVVVADLAGVALHVDHIDDDRHMTLVSVRDTARTHIYLSPSRARELAYVLLRAADDADAEADITTALQRVG